MLDLPGDVIASPREKIVQKALQLVLEAIWEERFLDSSHGFRPGRSCHSAPRFHYLIDSHHSWVIQGDYLTASTKYHTPPS